MAVKSKCPSAGRLLPPRSDANGCTHQEAQDALARYHARGKGLDPSNPDHVRAYMILRANSSRVNADRFLTFLRNAQETVAVGKREEMAIWAVPVQNFPHGPPDWMREHVKTVDELAEECLVSGTDIDVVGLYLIDQAVARHHLGNFVRTIIFYKENSTGGAVGRPQAARALADTERTRTQSAPLLPHPPLCYAKPRHKRQETKPRHRRLSLVCFQTGH